MDFWNWCGPAKTVERDTPPSAVLPTRSDLGEEWDAMAVALARRRLSLEGSTPPSALRADTSPFVLRKNGEDRVG